MPLPSGGIQRTALSPVAKQFRQGTHRTVSPEETQARLEPLLPALGITRLANITGLDRIGIPVFMACRPNSRSLSVFQGKGLDLASARVSALMEAVETFHAETIDLPLKLGSFEELRYSHDLAAVFRLPFSRDGLFDPLDPILWIEGEDLCGGGPKWLPFELVHANYTLPLLTGSGAFAATTNGLASGNHRLEALCHALYEVIERDAVTLWKMSSGAQQNARAVDLGTIDDPHCRSLLALFEAAEIDLVVWDVTSDVGVATFHCLAAGRSEATGAPEFGAGSHLDRGVALSRALTEAAQARTTYIAGSRDDITAEHYEEAICQSRHRQARGIVAETMGQRRFDAAPTSDGDSFDDDLAVILAALRAVGLDQVLAVDLTKPALRIPVVRVVVPGLEGAFEGPDADYVPGERALRILEAGP